MSFSLGETLNMTLDDEIFYILFHPEFTLPGLKEEISTKVKDSIEILKEIHKGYLELSAKLEKVQASSKNLSIIIEDSK